MVRCHKKANHGVARRSLSQIRLAKVTYRFLTLRQFLVAHFCNAVPDLDCHAGSAINGSAHATPSGSKCLRLQVSSRPAQLIDALRHLCNCDAGQKQDFVVCLQPVSQRRWHKGFAPRSQRRHHAGVQQVAFMQNQRPEAASCRARSQNAPAVPTGSWLGWAFQADTDAHRQPPKQSWRRASRGG